MNNTEILALSARGKQFLRRHGTSIWDAEDATQEALLRMVVYERGHEIDMAEAFLVRTVRNIAIDTKRRGRGDKYVPEPVEDLVLVDPAASAEEVVEAEQLRQHMRRILDQHNPLTTHIFSMHALEGMTYQEIAERLQMSERTVEKHLARARKWVEKLREIAA